MTDVAERLRAAGVAVKPLEWADWSARHRIMVTAEGYRITQRHFPDMHFCVERNGKDNMTAPTLEAAKAAAQADYEARVLAALCSTLERSAHTSPDQGLGPGETETRSDTGR